MRLRLDQVQSRRGTFAVGPVSAGLAAGDCVALVGVNGAGKTTLLETIAGFFPVVSGHVWLDGSDITAWPPERRGMAYLPQDLALFPHLSVAQNIAFAARRSRNGDGRSRTTTLVEEFGLADISARYPHELSRGQAQRVAFARALAARPAVLLLDEPAASLDLPGQRSFNLYMRRLLLEHRSTIVYATHNILDSLSLASQLIVLDEGRVVQTGTPESLFHAPASVRVAELLGITNLWPAEILGAVDGSVRVRVDGRELSCASGSMPRVPVCAAIGPGEIELLDGDPPDATNCFRAVIRNMQVGGQTALLDLDGGPNRLHAALPPSRTHGLAIGQTLWVRLPPDRVRLIPAA